MLKTDRLRLKQFDKKDLNSFFNIFSKEEVVEYLFFDTLSIEGAAAKLDKIIDRFYKDNDEKYKFFKGLSLYHKKMKEGENNDKR